MLDRMSKRMSDRMSDRMAGSTRDKMPNEMVEYMSDLCQIECQNIYIYVSNNISELMFDNMSDRIMANCV